MATGTHQLTVILIGRNHIDIVPLGRGLVCQSTDNIVGLITLDLIDGDAHSLQQTAQVGHRGDDILGCGGAVGLVLGVELATEATSLGVERYAQHIGFLALLYVAQKLREAEQNRGVHAMAVAHRATEEGVVVFEYERVGVDQK